MGEFNSDNHYIHYCGQFFRRKGVAFTVNKRVRNAVLGCSLKGDRMVSVCFQGKPFSIILVQVCAPTSHAERSWSWTVLWRPTAAAAKSLQSCLTLCDPIDGSPPGSPIPGILQARTLEWGAIPSKTNNQKRCPFHYRGLECKSRKSRDTWSDRQICPWSTKWSRARVTVLSREYTGHSKHPHRTTQEKTLHVDITRWSIPKSDLLHYL